MAIRITNTVLIDKPAALAAGLTRYYTGETCLNGHIAERLVTSGRCVQCKRDKMKRWGDKNPDYRKDETYVTKRRAVHAAVRDSNPELHRVKNRNYYKLRPEIWKMKRARRRALQSGAEGTFDFPYIVDIFNKQRGRCLCGVNIYGNYQIDHKTPLSRGGSNWPKNLQLLCQPCNGSKGTKTQREWLRVAKFRVDRKP